MYRLMIKTHNKTGLKYLCITKKKNWMQYSGSGTHWKNHLKKHGYDFSTELLFESDDYQLFSNKCKEYSLMLDVRCSEKFANQIDETGYNEDKNYLKIWQETATPEQITTMINTRSATMRADHWMSRPGYENSVRKIGISNKKNWEGISIETRRIMTEDIRKKAKNFFEDKTTEKYADFIKLKTAQTKEIQANTPFEVLSARNRKHRLNLSEEKKQARKLKLQAVWATGKHNHLFDIMSQKRKGVGNPRAKIICWFGVDYAKGEFYKMLKQTGINKSEAETQLDKKISNCFRRYEV